MNLPELPKQNRKRESDFGLVFRKWIMKNPRLSGAYELKDTRGKNYLNFNEVTDEQLSYGMSIKSDEGTLLRVQGINGEPDYVYFRSAPSYICIKYYRFFCLIDVETFILEKSRSKRKSLTGGRAKEIASFVVELSTGALARSSNMR